MHALILVVGVVLALSFGPRAYADAPVGPPAATIDLARPEGVALIKGVWRYHDTRIVESRFRAADKDGQPTGAPVQTYDYTPHAGGAHFDDSDWETIGPVSLSRRRGAGRLSFNWYRIAITIPARVGDFDTAGSTVVFDTSLDDYAEIWVDGELPRAAAQSGGSVVKGWNASNRLIIGRGVQPGQKIQLAIFGINGPISASPTNFIYIHHARLDFYRLPVAPRAVVPHEVNIEVERFDSRLDAIVPANPKLFKLAEGFKFTEGPIWVRDGNYLLFSDPNSNLIWRYQPEGEGTLNVFREHAGYSGADIAEYGQPGSNGLTLDRKGRLTINEHGNHRVVRIEKNGHEAVLADSYDGKRLNSPNDLVYRSDGALIISDPPFGLPKFHADPRRELPFSGVFALYKDRLTLLTDELSGPNGVAFSPDEKYLYVGNWDEKRKVVMRYAISRNPKITEAKVFADFTADPGEDAIDGVKVDRAGNVYISAPGGLWVCAPDGTRLGLVKTPRHAHNMAWGDDGKTLYLTAQGTLYRLPLMTEGVRP